MPFVLVSAACALRTCAQQGLTRVCAARVAMQADACMLVITTRQCAHIVRKLAHSRAAHTRAAQYTRAPRAHTRGHASRAHAHAGPRGRPYAHTPGGDATLGAIATISWLEHHVRTDRTSSPMGSGRSFA